MFSFKDPRDRAASLLGLIGVLLLVGCVIMGFRFPWFNKDNLKKQRNSQTRELTKRFETAKANLETSEIQVASGLWTERADEVSPAVLEKITKLVNAQTLRLVAFRPQRATESPALQQVPFVLTVDGPFTKVAELINQIEKVDTKIAVSQVAFASTEGETDLVSATIGLVAYTAKPIVEAAKAPLKTPASTTGATKEVPARG